MPITTLRRRGLLAAAIAAPLAAPRIARAAGAPLVIYDSLDFVGSAAKAFTAKTGIAVNKVEQGGTGGVLGKIAAEGDKPQYDMVWLEGSAVMERMSQNGIFGAHPDLAAKAPYTKLGRTLVPAGGMFFPTTASTTGITVNTKKIAPADYPKRWADLANPAYAGVIAAKDPNLSGPAFQWLAGFFQAIGEEKGKALLKQALSNKALSGLPSGGTVNKALLTGNAKLAITQDSATFGKIAAGEPLASLYPAEGVVATPSSIGISAKSANVAAARQFIEFVLSPEGQAAMLDGDDSDYFFVPIIEGVNAKPGRTTAVEFLVLDNAAAAKHETAWKAWYRESFVP
jgi:iron(III) transport system substrate-binding protein